ncbi:hypothetical protein BB561_004481 [Smittium simulii]|uniref:Uncharacterized protein n=1 Tax=Smittium simulii TaxID=133385 RepID=A0A2T9YG41_9FUNG|nr:hypothetical protein BB561_004481 [Smittium simulii]
MLLRATLIFNRNFQPVYRSCRLTRFFNFNTRRMFGTVLFEASWKDVQSPTISTVSIPFSEFVVKYPDSIYTSARTIHGSHVVAFNKHTTRLAKSLNLLIEETPDTKKNFLDAFQQLFGHSKYEDFLTEEFWNQSLLPWMTKGVNEYQKTILPLQNSTVLPLDTNDTTVEPELPSDIQNTKKFKPDAKDSQDSIKKNDPVATLNPLETPQKIKPLDTPAELNEAKISISISIKPLMIRMHITKFVDNNKKNQQIILVKGTRENPTAKHAHWAEDRKPLEDLIIDPVNEVVLYDHTTLFCTEGLSSNFFVIQKKNKSDKSFKKRINPTNNSKLLLMSEEYEVVTCPTDKILIGTIMQIVIDICKLDNIDVVYRDSHIALKNHPLIEHIAKRVLDQLKVDSCKIL